MLGTFLFEWKFPVLISLTKELLYCQRVAANVWNKNLSSLFISKCRMLRLIQDGRLPGNISCRRGVSKVLYCSCWSVPPEVGPHYDHILHFCSVMRKILDSRSAIVVHLRYSIVSLSIQFAVGEIIVSSDYWARAALLCSLCLMSAISFLIKSFVRFRSYLTVVFRRPEERFVHPSMLLGRWKSCTIPSSLEIPRQDATEIPWDGPRLIEIRNFISSSCSKAW